MANGGAVTADELTVASVAASGLRLCLYDAGAGPQPVVSVGVASGNACGARPCWRAMGAGPAARGLRYRDKEGGPGGVQAVRLWTTGPALEASLKARGPSLAAAGLPLAVPVTAQLVAGHGANLLCWQAVLTTVRHNDAEAVKVAQP